MRQLVDNEDFEITSIAMWGPFFSSCTIARSTAQAKRGLGSLECTAVGANAYLGVNAFNVDDIYEGEVMTAEWWVYPPSAPTVTPVIQDAGGDWSRSGTPVALTANAWNQLKVIDFAVGPWVIGSDELTFRMNKGAGTWSGEVAYLDVIRLFARDVPVVRGVGTVAAGIAAVSPGLPTGTVAGDLLIMFVETNNQAVTVSGWTEAPSSPQSDATDAHRLTIFYKIAVGGDATTTSDSGDHQVAQIIGIRAGTFDRTTPFNTSAGTTDTTSDTSGSCPAVTTTRDNCLIVAAAGSGRNATSTTEFSGWTNANLIGLKEQIDNVDTAGLGGGFGVATGVLASKGASGTTDVTYVTATRKGLITLAVNPPASNIPDPERRIRRNALLRM